jgi:hypothetical protein
MGLGNGGQVENLTHTSRVTRPRQSVALQGFDGQATAQYDGDESLANCFLLTFSGLPAILDQED